MQLNRPLVIVLLITLAACSAPEQESPMPAQEQNTDEHKTEIATLAGGCFWCVKADFERLPGVISVVSGYAGGEEEDPAYDEVSSGTTGHVEAVQIRYDPAVISYEQLLAHYWRRIDPTDDGGQFVDRGAQYRPVIFTHDEQQRRIAEASREALDKSGRFEKKVVVEIRPYTTFFEAEAYHQDYHDEHPIKYAFYRRGSGRDRFIGEHWSEAEAVLNALEQGATGGQRAGSPDVEANDEEEGDATDPPQTGAASTERGLASGPPGPGWTKPDETTLTAELTPLQYNVTQQDATEQAFNNTYSDETREGIYVDIVSGEPLFSSRDKYKSGTGWPSFTRPISDDAVVTKRDFKLIIPRTEIRSSIGDNHIGHVFNDGPAPTGKRYCMNSAAMTFIPKEEMEERGYGAWLEQV